MNVILSVDQICKKYSSPEQELDVLKDVSLNLQEQECFCLLGHSGCGKTTLLRIICGFEKADSGTVMLEGSIYDKPSKDIIMLFQDFNQLLPWKTVRGNIVHSLRATGLIKSKNDAKGRADAILKEVGLYDFRRAYPGQLSGGMKQRAAFARALVLRPKVLIMDEPFASLDYGNRKKLQKLTNEMCRKHNLTVLFVTHDIEEAIFMADRIAVMPAGSGHITEILDSSNLATEEERKSLQLHLMDCVL